MNPFDKQQINPSESSSRYVELEEGGKSSITPESKLQRPNLCLKIILGASCLVLAIVILSFSLLMYEQNLELGDVQSFPDSSKLTISVIAWNFKRFGTATLNDPKKMEGINNIIKSYDIIMLSELMQSDCDNNDACEMKNYFKQNYPEHDFYMSPSLGFRDDNVGKEQYGFLIRKTLNYQKELYYYPDPQGIFARKPYYIFIKEYNLYLAIVHTTPWTNKDWPNGSKTKPEVIELSRFFNSVTGDMILMGDLNLCDPSILDNEDIRKNFKWILKNSEMTNMNNQCAYDRIITRKDFSRYLEPKVIRNSNVKDLGLSDHYPIDIKVVS